MYAQSFQISGRVTDASDGSPLPGVTVQTQAKVGTVTDVDGNYALSVNKGDVLSFSYLGMITQTVKMDSQRAVNIALKSDDKALDELVVVGYGQSRKIDLAGASSSLGAKEIASSFSTNLDQALQGRVTGVTAVQTSGTPGSAVSIRIRGQATVRSGAEPLYVIDGVIFQGGNTSGSGVGLGDALGNGVSSSISPLSTLNPSDIVSMEILKDASATAIYGAQGSNGVVLITTKRGKSGEAKISYDGMFGISNQVKRLKMMNLREYAELNNTIAATTGGSSSTPEYLDPSLLGRGTDWQDAIFRQAYMNQHNVSAQGGNEQTKYFLSGSWMNQEGTMIGTDFKRFSFRANMDTQLKSWIKVGLNAMYSRTDENLGLAEGSEGVLTYSLTTPPDIPIYDVDGNYAMVVRENYSRPNPIAIANLDENTLKRQKLNGNIFADITPMKNLVWHADFGFDVSDSRAERWRPTYFFGETNRRDKNTDSWQRNNNLYWAVTNYLTYSNKIDKHAFTAMLGQEAWESSWEYQSIAASDLPSNDIHNPALTSDKASATINSGFGSAAMASFFTRATYNFDDRYLGTYTYRYDGSSNFGPKNRFAGFHSFAVAWRFNQEAFFESLRNTISNGKLRIGWGGTGNQRIGGYLWGGSGSSNMSSALGTAYKQSNIANPYIRWESQNQWNLGLDLGFFSDRINLVVDLYDKTANNMLMSLQLPTYMGTFGNPASQLSAPMGNYGTINNKGLEIALNTHNLTGQFKWDTDFQISFNKNKLVALDGTEHAALEGKGQWREVVSRSEVGESLYNFYGYIADGVYKDVEEIRSHLWGEVPANGVYDRYSTVFVGDVKYRDLNNDGIIDERDRTNIGSPLPKFTFGMTNTFNYKNFDLIIFLNGSYGNKILNYLSRDLTSMDADRNQLQKAMDYARIAEIDQTVQYPLTKINAQGESYTINNWFEDPDNVYVTNPDTKISRAGRGLPYDNKRVSTLYIEDGSYLRIKNITLGYTVPKQYTQKWKIENVRVYANIQNILTFTKYAGYDPEIGIYTQDPDGNVFGIDYGRYPSPRTVTFGLNFSF
ncbi:MAG: TonB-dependent receptor [Dysgonamonadaceae bacterium]|nr:TonB-dependent receptor [Dysgonamonadaceae bacterium]